MKDGAERYFLLWLGCASQSSVGVATISKANKNLALPKPKRFAAGLRRFINRVKNLSHQLFRYKEEVDHTDDEEMEEIEIGFPTDVKHVMHIGLDGTTTMHPMKGWENLNPNEIISFPFISIRQFELSMAAQAHVATQLAATAPAAADLKLLQG